jgi:hypothetical protein
MLEMCSGAELLASQNELRSLGLANLLNLNITQINSLIQY